MPTLTAAIDARGAAEGAREFRRASRGIQRDAGVVTGAVNTARGALTRLFGTLAAGFGVAQFFRNTAQFESGLLGVAKTADLTDSELKELGRSVGELSSRIPVTSRELLTLAEAAGQVGVRGVSDLLRFSETVAKLGTVTDLAGEEAVSALGQILSVTGEATSQVDRLASVLAALEDQNVKTASVIANTATQVAAASSQFDVSSAEAAGLAAALVQIGTRSELAGSAIGRTFRAIDAAARSGGDSLQLLARLAGTTAEEFREQFAQNATVALQLFIEGLGRASAQGENASAILERLGLAGEELNKVLPTLAKRSELLGKNLEIANREFRNAVALEEQFERQSGSLANQFQILLNNLNRFFVSTEEDGLLGIIKQAVRGLNLLSGSILGIEESTLDVKDAWIILSSDLERIWSGLQATWEVVVASIRAAWDSVINVIRTTTADVLETAATTADRFPFIAEKLGLSRRNVGDLFEEAGEFRRQAENTPSLQERLQEVQRRNAERILEIQNREAAALSENQIQRRELELRRSQREAAEELSRAPRPLGGAAGGVLADEQQRLSISRRLIEDLQLELSLIGRRREERERGLALASFERAAEEEELQNLGERRRQFDLLFRELQRAQRLKDVADDIGQAFARAVGDIILEFESLRDFFENLLKEFQRILITQLVVNPLAEATSSALQGFVQRFLPALTSGVGAGIGAGAGGSGGQAGASTTTSGTSSSGELPPFTLGTISRNQLGTVFNVPTRFQSATGERGVLGEVPEGLLPLGRDSAGRLGVRLVEGSAGGGRSVTVNFTVITPDANSFRRSEKQQVARLQRVARGLL